MTITFRQLEHFAAVAELGTVTAAAQHLHLSQSAVSTAVSDLEKALKVQLFIRQARGLVLTRDGQSILAHARQLLRDVDNLERNAGRLGQELTGTLHIGCYATIAPVLMPRLVAEFAESHPAIDIRFSEGSRSDLLRQLMKGECDVAVMYDYRFGDQLTEVGDVVPLGSVRPYALLPAEHPRATAGEVSLADLAQEPFILFDLEPASEYFLSLFSAAGLTPTVRFRTASFEVLRGLVAQGLGCSLLSQRASHMASLEGLDYAAVELDGSPEALDIVAVMPGNGNHSRRVQLFLRQAAEVLSTSPRYYPACER
ncbi:LysR family transcriptional regulator [Citricoccus alkalitolerans]|uniref:LysR family transcriptional regulator n=1 Tax=Citricoccus alkalitolerans TaxID=246603 RepID=A0ABV8XY09_9MICC